MWVNDSVVLSLSGGMDSSGLLLDVLHRNPKAVVLCVSYDYGQKHAIEIACAARTVGDLARAGFAVSHKIIDLKSAMSSLAGALTQPDTAVPEGHYEQENMVATVVPNRNAIFSAILYAQALSLQAETGGKVSIALGVHSGDHAIYPDCRPEFYEQLAKAFGMGNYNSDQVDWYLPFLEGDKVTILQRALFCCADMKIDFDNYFANTNTSYNPTPEGLASGKSGADVERILAFHEINRMDPVRYDGGWFAALENALKVKADWDLNTKEKQTDDGN